MTIRVADDRVFGSLVVLGTGGAAHAQAARLTPLTDTDADKLIRTVAHGAPPLRDLLLRVSRLAEDLPEVTDSTLPRSSPARTGLAWWRAGQGNARTSRRTRSCASCA